VEYLTARGPQQNQLSEQLHRNLQLVQRVERFCKEDLTNINQLGSRQWPRTKQEVELELIRDKLRGNYRYIMEKCTSITLQCERTSNALVGLAQREESRAGVRESRNVANLTMLALLFIPLNYISSCFSMNITPITEEGVPFWFWAVPSGISALVTGIAIAVLWWKRTH
jgi:Mg2+ and Co2+ transporter CorA